MIFKLLLICIFILFAVEKSVSLSVHDPRLSPGHLKPLGTGRPKHPVESAVDYPSPQGRTIYHVSSISILLFFVELCSSSALGACFK